MKSYARGYVWMSGPSVDPAVHAVGELRVPMKGRSVETRRDCWVLDYSCVSGTYYRLGPKSPWRPRPAGEGHLYAPDTPFWSKSDPSSYHVSHSLYVMFTGRNNDTFKALFRSRERFVKFIDPSALLGRRLQVLVNIGVRYGESGFPKAQAAFWRVLDFLLHSSLNADGDRMIQQRIPIAGGEAFVDRVEHYLRDRLAEKVTRETMAQALGVSVSTLSHRYREATGVSPIQRLIWLRVETAKFLIRSGTPLKAVADATGFCDEFHLSKVFKKTVGISSQEYFQRRNGPKQRAGL